MCLQLLASFAFSSFGNVSLSISGCSQRLNPPVSASKFSQVTMPMKGLTAIKPNFKLKYH